MSWYAFFLQDSIPAHKTKVVQNRYAAHLPDFIKYYIGFEKKAVSTENVLLFVNKLLKWHWNFNESVILPHLVRLVLKLVACNQPHKLV